MLEHGRLEERDDTLGVIAEALVAARRARGRLIVIDGPAGIGKTSVLEVVAARADGERVLAARAHEIESRFVLGVVRQLLEPIVAGASAEERARWFAGAASLAAPVFDEGVAASDLFPLLHGLHWLLANVAAEDPVVLLVDDAQWADTESLLFLGYLARRLADLPILVAVTARPAGERPVELDDVVATPGTTVIHLGPLTAAAVDAVVRRRLPAADPTFVAACAAATDGNPFLLHELLVEVEARELEPVASTAEAIGGLSPGGVSTAIGHRLARLPATARPVAEAIAVLGDGAAVDDVGALAGLDAEATATAVVALRRAGIVLGDRAGLGFVHPIVRSTVLAGIDDVERPLRHRAAATLLLDQGRRPDAIAAHLLEAPPSADVRDIDALRQAAAYALGLGAPWSAVTYLWCAAAAVGPGRRRDDVLLELGRALAVAGRLREAEAALAEVVGGAGALQQRAVAALELARVRKFGGHPLAAADVLLATLAEPAVVGTAVATALELELLGLGYSSVRARRRVMDRLGAIIDDGRPPENDRQAFRLASAAMEQALAGRERDAVVDAARRAVSRRPLPTDPATAGGFGVMMVAVTLMWCDELAEAGALMSAVVDAAHRSGSPLALSTGAGLRALVGWRRGAVADAELDVDIALTMARDLAVPPPLLPAAVATGLLAGIERATTTEALAALEGKFASEPVDPDSTPFGLVLHARGRLRATAGDLDGAIVLLQEAGVFEHGWGSVNPAVLPWRADLAAVLVQQGAVAEARRVAAEELAAAERFGAPRPIAIALRAVAATAPTEERPALLEQSIALLKPIGADLELARAYHDLGVALRLARHNRESRAPLRNALDLAARCGAARLERQAVDELQASGARPRRTALTGTGALTPSERRVAELAASGSTNRRIAQMLFISEKTVETHLSHVFDKLDTRSRRALGELLSPPAQIAAAAP